MPTNRYIPVMASGMPLESQNWQSYFFEDFQVGQTWLSATRTITETDISFYAWWSGDNHPLHTDEEYAKATPFGTRVLHGPAVFAIATGLESRLRLKDESAVAFLGMNWEMKRAVVTGDTIRAEVTVDELRGSVSTPSQGVVTFAVRVLNQLDEICQFGTWSVMIAKRSA